MERILPICFFAALLAGIALVVYVGCTFRVDDLLIDNQKAAPFNTEWQSLHADGTSDAVTLPCTVLTEENTAATLINQLPAEQDGEQVICIETSHQRIRAYVDQELLYEAGYYPKPAFGQIFGSAWHFIPIPQDAQGKTIRLESTIPYAKRTTDINGVMLGPKSAIVLQILKSNLTTLAFCITTFLRGVLFILIYGVFRKKRAGRKIQAYLYLALFVLLTSVWALTDSKRGILHPSDFSALGNCFRIGGDEFAVILSGRTKKQVQAGLDALNQQIEEHNAAHTHKIDIAYGYTFSDGADAQQIKEALRQADQRMYDQKAGGARQPRCNH